MFYLSVDFWHGKFARHWGLYLPCWYDASSVVSYAGKKGDMRFGNKNLLLFAGKK